MAKKTTQLAVLFIALVVALYIIRPKLAVFLNNRGIAYYDQGQYEKAAGYFLKSLQINPSSTMAHYNLGNVYRQLKREGLSIAEYRKAIKVSPGFIKAYLAISSIYLNRERYQDALDELRKAEVVKPGNQELKLMRDYISFEYMADCLNKGTDSLIAGDRDVAYDLLNKAVMLRPDFAFSHYALAVFYFAEHNNMETEVSLNEAIKLDGQFFPAYKLFADISFEEGNFEKAVDCYKKAIAINSNDPVLYNDLGLALMQMERYAESLEYLKKAQGLAPDNPNIQYSLASVYRDNNMFDQAVSEYQKLASNKPDYPGLHNDLGDIYKKDGKENLALREYNQEIDNANKLLLGDSKNIIALNNLAYAYSMVGQYSKAKEAIDRALEFAPTYIKAYLTLASVYESADKHKEAVMALIRARALSRQPGYIDRDIDRLRNRLGSLSKVPESSSNLAVIYLKNGRKIEGKIVRETQEKITLEVDVGDSPGTIALNRNDIERMSKSQ